MGFWDWFKRRGATDDVASPWRPTGVLERVTLADLYGLDDVDNLPITRESAMQVPALARARNIIAPGIGRMPLIAHKRDGATDQQPSILQQPDPAVPAIATWTWAVDELMWHGSAWFYTLEEDSAGRPTRARVLPSRLIDFDTNGDPIGYRGRRTTGNWFRVDGPHEGILAYGRDPIRSAIAIERAYRRNAEMPVPMVELHQTSPTPKLTDDERTALIASWVTARRGKNGAVGYTSSNVETKTHGLPAETLLVAARDAASLDMARVAGLPAWAVDAAVQGSSITYANVTDRNRELVDFAFAGYMAALEGRLSMDDILPRGTWARFNSDDFLRGDLKARAEAYAAAKEVGLMTDEQIRTAEAGQPREG